MKLFLRHVGELLSEENKEEKAMSRKIFMIILQNIAFLARQGLHLRGGHGDLESNFLISEATIFLKYNPG